MLEVLQPDPALRRFAHVYVGDDYIMPTWYAHVRPKAGALVTLRVVPQGGGGGKNPLRTILMIGILAASLAVGYFGAAPLLGSAFGAGTFGATLLAGGIALAGSLITSVLFPARPPSLPALTGFGESRDSPTLFIEGARNQLRSFEVVPVVLGRHKQTPPYAAKPFTEAMGATQYVRILVCWGVGPLQIDDIRIGETPIADFDEVEIETRQGYPSDAPLTLYTQDVEQDDLSIRLLGADDWTARTAAADADELGIDISFPAGFFNTTDTGKRAATDVRVQAQYRLVGAAVWTDVPGDASISFPREWLQPPTITFTHNSTAAIRHGLRWPVARGQYEVRVRRISPDPAQTHAVDESWWTALRRFKNEAPIDSPVPLALTALRIKATDQLNNVVDELNAVVTSIAPDWNGTAWVSGPTRNPASLYRLILQGAGISETLADARIDLDGLQDFHDFCRVNGFTFDMVRDFESSVWNALADVAAAGRASPTQRDGKWSVAIDRPQAYPVQHFTPRNSWGFSAEKAFVDLPHGWRVRFVNEDQRYANDERIVYDDGYSDANATRFEGLELPGVVDPDLIWKHARFHIAQARLRPERWTLFADIEHIVCRRGSLVKVTHDVLLVGLAQGRIVQVHEDTNGDVAGVTVDEVLTMEAGTDYGLSIRTPGNPALLAALAADPGEQTEVFFTASIPAAQAPDIGDLFGFGELGAETVDALVLAIEPQADFKARLLLVPYQAGVYTADTGTIPPFDTGLTALETVPAPVVLRVRSDESALVKVGATLEVRVEIDIQPLALKFVQVGAVLDVQSRPSASAEPYRDAEVTTRRLNGATLVGVTEGETIDIRLRWRVQDRLPGPWATIAGHLVVGKGSPPAAPQGLTISVFGGSALLRWDPPSDIDVRFGGTIRFRHSPVFTGAAWAESTSIGNAANSTALVAVLPLKPGTYLARTFDSAGNPSAEIAAVTTIQASVLEFANVDTVTEDPAFAGAHDGTVEDGGVLKLAGQGLLDDVADFDAIENLDSLGGIASAGVYGFAAGLDLATTESDTQRVRLTSHIEAISVNELDLIDDRGTPMDSWEDFDGTVQGAADCQVWVRHTDDDPAATAPAWSDWQRLDSAEFEARGFEFEARLATVDPAFNINVSELSVVVDRLAA